MPFLNGTVAPFYYFLPICRPLQVRTITSNFIEVNDIKSPLNTPFTSLADKFYRILMKPGQAYINLKTTRSTNPLNYQVPAVVGNGDTSCTSNSANFHLVTLVFDTNNAIAFTGPRVGADLKMHSYR
jgi:hypothetical protein